VNSLKPIWEVTVSLHSGFSADSNFGFSMGLPPMWRANQL
jgi:hypothetical protein